MRTIITALTMLTLAACGEVDYHYTDASPTVPDASPPDEGPPPEYFVARAMALPESSDEAIGTAFDLDGDGTLDNQIGQMFAALHDVTAGDGFGTGRALETAIGDGSLIQLVAYQGPGSGGDPAPTFAMYRGGILFPVPCAPDGTCGLHLRGDASFEVRDDGPRDAPLTGTSQEGAGRESFMGGPGPLTIQFAFSPDEAFDLPLIGARVDLIGITDGGIDRLVIGGAMSIDVMQTLFLGELAETLQAQVQADCRDFTAPDCGCVAESLGEKWLALFDTQASHCILEDYELAASSLMQTVTAPDVMIDGVPGTSFSITMTATTATFTP